MDNWLKHQKDLKKSELQQTLKSKEDITHHNRHNKNATFSLRSKARVETWINDNDVAKGMLDPLKNGSMPLLHVTLYKHRTRDKELELDPKGILVRSFMTAKDRANDQEKKIKGFLMDRDDYNPNLPFKSSYLRDRDAAKELNYAMRFGLHPRTENARIIENITYKKSHIDHNKRDMKMVHDPDWKPTDKNKWLGNQTFLTRNCNFTQSKRSFLPWVQLPLVINDETEHYIDGYETMGDLSRKRDKSKESHRPNFESTISQDLWNHNIQTSNSWRTQKSDGIFNVNENFDEFSKNDKKINYKKTLINTGSVDHSKPFPHSNNVRGQALRDFRPNYHRIYNQSIKEYMKNNKKEANPSQLTKKPSEFSNKISIHEKTETKYAAKHPSIIEENDSPLSTSSSKLFKKRKELMFLSKEDKIKLAITKSFGSLS